MSGGFAGLICGFSFAQSPGMADLMLKINIMLEAIVWQTCHIVDMLNAEGHSSCQCAKGAAFEFPSFLSGGIPCTLY